MTVTWRGNFLSKLSAQEVSEKEREILLKKYKSAKLRRLVLQSNVSEKAIKGFTLVKKKEKEKGKGRERNNDSIT